jgi:hypothetical protein
MRYKPGDIVIDFDDHVLFQWTKQDDKRKYIHRLRLATPGEAGLFLKHSREKKPLTFEQFKKIMPAFDGRRLKGIIYDHIEVDEGTFLFFREVETNFHARTYEDKLSFVIMKYLQAGKHNVEMEGIEFKKLQRMKALLFELLSIVKE